jgi:hypothetical protein
MHISKGLIFSGVLFCSALSASFAYCHAGMAFHWPKLSSDLWPSPIWPVISTYCFLIGQLLRKDKLSHPPQSYLTLLSCWLSYAVSHSWNVRNPGLPLAIPFWICFLDNDWISTRIYDKRVKFDIHVVHFPFIAAIYQHELRLNKYRDLIGKSCTRTWKVGFHVIKSNLAGLRRGETDCGGNGYAATCMFRNLVSICCIDDCSTVGYLTLWCSGLCSVCMFLCM